MSRAGFKRESDTISLSQMLHGIATRDGRVLDRGVGLSKKTLLDALDSGEQHTAPQETAHHPTPSTESGNPAQITLAPTDPPARELAGAGDAAAVLEPLVAQGVTPRIARGLVAHRPGAAIRQQVAWQAYRPAAKSPAGALVQAIRDAWPPPPARLEAQAHAAAVARQAEAERRREAEDAARRRGWAAKPPEERVAGYLQFWLLGRRRKGREPSAGEVEAKRAELLAGLTGGAAGDAGAVGGGA